MADVTQGGEGYPAETQASQWGNYVTFGEKTEKAGSLFQKEGERFSLSFMGPFSPS